MSLYVVERQQDWFSWPDRWGDWWLHRRPEYDLVDTGARDGEWHAVITLTHEIVEHDGYAVPAFEGDLERIEWERNRKFKRRPLFLKRSRLRNE